VENRGRPRWTWILLAWLVPAVIASLQSALGYAFRGALGAEWPYAMLQAPRWLAWALFTPLIFTMQRRFPVARAGILRALLAHWSASMAITTVIELSWLPVSLLVSTALEPNRPLTVPWSTLVTAAVFGRLITGAFIYAAVLGVATSLDYQQRLRSRDVQASRLEAQLAQSQLAALKTQIHPHFLFNTLHAVTVLVREDPSAAIRMVTRLGDLLRLTLSRTQTQEVSLRSELELVMLFLDIERTRFADRLDVHVDVPAATLDAALPDLILQPLVENAIKHGIARSAGRGTIHINARRDGAWLEVQVVNTRGDNTTVHAPAPDGIGLSVTRERLERLYGRSAEFTLMPMDPHRVVARVRVPYRELPHDPVGASRCASGADAVHV
jgi:hypothetical protein